MMREADGMDDHEPGGALALFGLVASVLCAVARHLLPLWRHRDAPGAADVEAAMRELAAVAFACLREGVPLAEAEDRLHAPALALRDALLALTGADRRARAWRRRVGLPRRARLRPHARRRTVLPRRAPALRSPAMRRARDGPAPPLHA